MVMKASAVLNDKDVWAARENKATINLLFSLRMRKDELICFLFGGASAQGNSPAHSNKNDFYLIGCCSCGELIAFFCLVAFAVMGGDRQSLRGRENKQEEQSTKAFNNEWSESMESIKHFRCSGREAELVIDVVDELNGPPSFFQRSAASPSTTPTNRSLWRRIGGGWLNGRERVKTILLSLNQSYLFFHSIAEKLID